MADKLKPGKQRSYTDTKPDTGEQRECGPLDRAFDPEIEQAKRLAKQNGPVDPKRK